MSLFSGRNDKRDDAAAGSPGGTGSPGSGRATGSGRDARGDTEPTRASQATGPARGNRDRQGGAGVATIGESVVFKGDLTSDEDLTIEGRVEGQIRLPSHQLTIGAHSRVHAEIEAKNLIVVGHVIGNITATERCEIQASGVVEGDVRAPRLLIQEGAIVNGTIEMGDKAAEPVAPPA